LSHVVTTSAIYYDPDPQTSIIKADQKLLDFYNDTGYNDGDDSQVSPWVIRFELDATKMMGRSLSMELIDNKLNEAFADYSINIIRQIDLEEDQKLVLRLRIPEMELGENETTPIFLKQVEDNIMN